MQEINKLNAMMAQRKNMLSQFVGDNMYKVVGLPDCYYTSAAGVYGGFDDLNDGDLKAYLTQLSNLLQVDVYTLDCDKAARPMSPRTNGSSSVIEYGIECFSFDKGSWSTVFKESFDPFDPDNPYSPVKGDQSTSVSRLPPLPCQAD